MLAIVVLVSMAGALPLASATGERVKISRVSVTHTLLDGDHLAPGLNVRERITFSSNDRRLYNIVEVPPFHYPGVTRNGELISFADGAFPHVNAVEISTTKKLLYFEPRRTTRTSVCAPAKFRGMTLRSITQQRKVEPIVVVYSRSSGAPQSIVATLSSYCSLSPDKRLRIVVRTRSLLKTATFAQWLHNGAELITLSDAAVGKPVQFTIYSLSRELHSSIYPTP